MVYWMVFIESLDIVLQYVTTICYYNMLQQYVTTICFKISITHASIFLGNLVPPKQFLLWKTLSLFYDIILIVLFLIFQPMSSYQVLAENSAIKMVSLLNMDTWFAWSPIRKIELRKLSRP